MRGCSGPGLHGSAVLSLSAAQPVDHCLPSERRSSAVGTYHTSIVLRVVRRSVLHSYDSLTHF